MRSATLIDWGDFRSHFQAGESASEIGGKECRLDAAHAGFANTGWLHRTGWHQRGKSIGIVGLSNALPRIGSVDRMTW